MHPFFLCKDCEALVLRTNSNQRRCKTCQLKYEKERRNERRREYYDEHKLNDYVKSLMKLTKEKHKIVN